MIGHSPSANGCANNETFPDGVCWVDLAALNDATPMPASTLVAPTFTLNTPDGKTVSLTVTKCGGTHAGQYLELVAANTADVNDPNRIEVQVSGNHQAAGRAEKMFVAVFIGPKAKTIFSGNHPTASITVEANGAGKFNEVAVINISDSPNYQYNKEYKFSGQWTCVP
jgi:hypothetical protein